MPAENLGSPFGGVLCRLCAILLNSATDKLCKTHEVSMKSKTEEEA